MLFSNESKYFTKYCSLNTFSRIILFFLQPSVSTGLDVSDVAVESIHKYLKTSQNEERLRQIVSQDAAADGTTLSHEELAAIKKKKRLLTQGTDLFNQRPEKGVQFLQENGILSATLDPLEIAHFLRENSGLDKKMIGEYISKKKNVESKILEVFVKSFDFAGLTIDQALRLYLETFRLPGEAPLIFLVMEHFADHWHVSIRTFHVFMNSPIQYHCKSSTDV